MSSSRVHNTLGVSSTAARLVEVRSVEALQRYLTPAVAEQVWVLGEGSNVILAPELAGRVCVMRILGKRMRETGNGQVDITAGAGENWHALVRWSLGQGIYGLENLALIPGSTGAAPVQNIGAYGVELSDLFLELNALDLRTGQMVVLDSSDCEFSYRGSLFKSSPQRFAITSITLRLSRRANPHTDYPDIQLELQRLGIARPSPEQVAAAVIRVRRRKLPDPRKIPNAGSFFRNPVITTAQAVQLAAAHPQLKRFEVVGGVKLSAAQLIDRCGWKSKQAGSLRVWQHQPLVLVNPEGLDGERVLKFANAIRQDVFARFGVQLEIEPDTIGFS